MPANILAIGISSNPLRIYVSTENELQVFKVEEEAKSCCVLQGIRNVEKIRFQHGLVILCSNTCIVGFSFEEDTSTWIPEFVIKRPQQISTTILDGLLVHETKLLVLSVEKKAFRYEVKEEVLGWEIYNYKDLAADYSKTKAAIEFLPRNYWPAQLPEFTGLGAVLDISSEGLCLVSSYNSKIWIINLMKEGDNPISGLVGSGYKNSSTGYGCFLRSCGFDSHQATFIFCRGGEKYLEWHVAQQEPNLTNFDMKLRIRRLKNDTAEGYKERLVAANQPTQNDQYVQDHRIISSWRSRQIDYHNNTVYLFCYHFSSGMAFIWNSKQLGF